MRRIQRSSLSLILAYLTNATTIDSTVVSYNGYLVGYTIIVPTLDSGTATLNIKDADGNIIYTKTGIAVGTTFVPLTGTNAIPLSGNNTWEIVTSASQTANRTFGIKPVIDSFL